MTFKQRVRNWLGLGDLEMDFTRVHRELKAIRANQNQQMVNEHHILTACAVILGQIDPNYVRSEFDPERKKASDELGQKVINKLVGEFKASTMYPKDLA